MKLVNVALKIDFYKKEVILWLWFIMSLDPKSSLKKKIYQYDEVRTWLQQKKRVRSEITSGESGESFAVYFYPDARARGIDYKKLVGNVAMLLDKDKPFGAISTIRLETYKGKTALRIGWSS